MRNAADSWGLLSGEFRSTSYLYTIQTKFDNPKRMSAKFEDVSGKKKIVPLLYKNTITSYAGGVI